MSHDFASALAACERARDHGGSSSVDGNPHGPMPNVLTHAVVVAVLAPSVSLAAAQPSPAAHMQPVDWYTNAITADQARSRENADRTYYNRQYNDRQYENQRYNNQLYNQQYYNRQYYDRQYENQRYNKRVYNQQYNNRQYYNQQYYNHRR